MMWPFRTGPSNYYNYPKLHDDVSELIAKESA